MVISPEQNLESNGYGAGASLELPNTCLLRLWANLYRHEYFPTYEDVKWLEKQKPAEFELLYAKVESDAHLYFNKVGVCDADCRRG